MGSALADAAAYYASLHLPVFPLLPKTKHPAFKGWQDAANGDPATVDRWWKQNPNYNIGFACGTKSNAFVFDVDPRNGGADSYELLISEHGRMPDTWQQITGGGGMQFFFRFPAFKVGNCAGMWQGIDIKGEGGYVVVPPSIHPDTGREYQWDGLEDIDHTPLGEAPEWLIEALHHKFCPVQEVHHSDRLPIGEKIHKGVQHVTLVSLAGAMRRMGMSATDIYPTLWQVNQDHCDEPGPAENIWKIAESMDRYQVHDKSLFSTATKLWRLTKYHEEREKERKESYAAVDGYELLTHPPDPIQELVEGVFHNGLTILAGPPKSGKSWLVLGLALAVASGGRFLGSLPVKSAGSVAYFALEESQRRTSGRIKKLVLDDNQALRNIEFMYELPALEQGGIAHLEQYIVDRAPSMVIIDTLMAFVTGDKTARGDVFRQDYREIKALQDIATKHDTAILVVHHTNKVGGDGVQAVAGSHGVTAAADCIWTLRRQPQKRAMFCVTGREVDDQEFLLELDIVRAIGWNLIGEGEAVRYVEEREEIQKLLRVEGQSSASKIAGLLRLNANRVRDALEQMRREGLADRNQSGQWWGVGSSDGEESREEA